MVGLPKAVKGDLMGYKRMLVRKCLMRKTVAISEEIRGWGRGTLIPLVRHSACWVSFSSQVLCISVGGTSIPEMCSWSSRHYKEMNPSLP